MMDAGTIEQQLSRLPSHLSGRFLADQRDREDWTAKRRRGIGASFAAKLAREGSVGLYVRDMIHHPFDGNAATAHGNAREPFMLAAFHCPQNTLMFHAADNPRFMCTPDGIRVGADGSLILVQAKTTNKDFRTIPRGYIRQVLWERYVIGADRAMLVWEVHEGYRPRDMEPFSAWIDPDDYPGELERMQRIGAAVLAALDEYDEFTREMELSNG